MTRRTEVLGVGASCFLHGRGSCAHKGRLRIFLDYFTVDLVLSDPSEGSNCNGVNVRAPNEAVVGSEGASDTEDLGQTCHEHVPLPKCRKTWSREMSLSKVAGGGARTSSDTVAFASDVSSGRLLVLAVN